MVSTSFLDQLRQIGPIGGLLLVFFFGLCAFAIVRGWNAGTPPGDDFGGKLDIPEDEQGPEPIDMVLHCPACGLQHIDKADEFKPDGRCTCAGPDGPCETCCANEELHREWLSEGPWLNPPHRTHLCHGCGFRFRPADVPTNGVAAVKTKGKDDSPIPGNGLIVRVAGANEINYPRDFFAQLIDGNSPYAFYLFQWVPYQTDAKRWRLKMKHDVRTFDGREALGIWPNADSCGPFKDHEVKFIRISRQQWGAAWADPRPARGDAS